MVLTENKLDTMFQLSSVIYFISDFVFKILIDMLPLKYIF